VRIHVLSDLHLEFGSPPPPAVDADVVVLAGDIARGTDGVQWASEWSDGRPVLYVAGNHEFYGRQLATLISELRAAAAGTSVHVLENDELEIEGVRFLGCTLWSDFDYGGPNERAASMAVCARVVRDYRLILDRGGTQPITPPDTRAVHLTSREWLERRTEQRRDGPTVVISHHAPLVFERPRDRALRALAGAFASDLGGLIDAGHENLWIFGHTHRAADIDVGGTRVISNPRGYPHEPVAAFDPAMTVELSSAPDGPGDRAGARAIRTVEPR
jgi:predicted phosphodiesterase